MLTDVAFSVCFLAYIKCSTATVHWLYSSLFVVASPGPGTAAVIAPTVRPIADVAASPGLDTAVDAAVILD
jgi:hypothetical protein